MSDTAKPRIRVPAGSEGRKSFATDSFQNMSASLGYGQNNLLSGSTYGFNPISRNHTQMEWAYRGSWIVRQVVDAVADDMTRAGINLESDMRPDQQDAFYQYLNQMLVWARFNEGIKWGRLYGGAIGVIMIDGQTPSSPLNLNSITKGQFKGIMVLDRWMVWPHLEDQVKDLGNDFGMPKYYEVVADARSIPHMKIHHSRVVRFEGVELPYWQRIAENYWGLSVIEPLYDRLIAFDSATTGAAQLVYRAHLRTLKIEKLRELIAFGGPSYQAVLQQIALIRLMQSNEGMTILDSTDDFDAHAYAFGGLSDMLNQFGQQLSGAAQIPLTRLFGQAPAGLNATGESDMRNYYDTIRAQQEARLRRPYHLVLDIAHRSLFGAPLPNGFNFSFNPLWQMTDSEKATTASTITTAVEQTFTAGLIGRKTALKELRQASHVTGVWSNITDEDIAKAEEDPEDPNEGMGMGMPGQPGAAPAAPGKPGEQPPAAGGKPPAGQPKPPPHVTNPHLNGTKTGSNGKLPGDIPKLQANGKDGSIRFRSREDVAAHFGPPKRRRLVLKDNGSFAQDKLSMLDFQGLPVVIETHAGDRRTGYGWAVQMAADYGYIQGTGSNEGGSEQMDCFIGPDHNASQVWIIEQIDPETKKFDEHKCCLGFASKQDALDAYTGSHTDDGEKRIGRVISMQLDDFRKWLLNWPHHTDDGDKPAYDA